MSPSDLQLTRRRLTPSAGARQLALLLVAMGYLILPGAASAGWKIIEKPDELRVANGIAELFAA